MSRRATVLLASALAALPAAPAAAAAAGGGVRDLLLSALNFALLLGALVYFARKPIASFFADRRGQIREELDSAAELLTQAEARCAEWQGKLENLERELERIRELASRRAESERERILADATAAAQRIREDARQAVDQEVARARAQLREEASELAVQMAAERLRDQIDDGDRARLLDEFIAHIETDADGGSRSAR